MITLAQTYGKNLVDNGVEYWILPNKEMNLADLVEFSDLGIVITRTYSPDGFAQAYAWAVNSMSRVYHEVESQVERCGDRLASLHVATPTNATAYQVLIDGLRSGVFNLHHVQMANNSVCEDGSPGIHYTCIYRHAELAEKHKVMSHEQREASLKRKLGDAYLPPGHPDRKN